MTDLILRNGHLMDPANGFHGVIGDIAMKGGVITAVGDVPPQEALHEIDLKGALVTAGLVDFHAHFFSGGTNTALEFYQYLSSGVTNAVDAG